MIGTKMLGTFALGKLGVNSIVCDPRDPKKIYRVVEHITIFDGYDLDYSYGDNEPFSYGETKRLTRVKNLENGGIYRYPAKHKMLYLEGPSDQQIKEKQNAN